GTAGVGKRATRPVGGRDDAHVPGNRFDDDRGDENAIGVEDAADRVEVVVGRDQRVGRRGARHAGAGRRPECQRAGAGFDEERIRMAVIAALELEKAVAPGGGPRDADSAHRGFGAGADEPYALERWHERAYALREGDLERTGRAEARAVARGGGERLHETGRGVAVNERP